MYSRLTEDDLREPEWTYIPIDERMVFTFTTYYHGEEMIGFHEGELCSPLELDLLYNLAIPV